MNHRRNYEQDDSKGKCQRSDSGSDRVIVSDLPTARCFAYVHHILLSVWAGLAHYTTLVAGASLAQARLAVGNEVSPAKAEAPKDSGPG
jgi:hypothetical protein